ncbi:hypothetical protein BOTBODRAFT_25821 [Botryobasidium botryosum FD-172 SS1]|uniref:Bola-like protein n=1 Tax=Botryobasidium botryosum (strain FD-172 SS1) TaxID=930990 RepID=A0A067N364_BOTB1|nr:hypothetical protein BOTBODRAFT_25821 [Botryobasidium botryosum FD-172 SS1]
MFSKALPAILRASHTRHLQLSTLQRRMATATSQAPGPVENSIRTKLTESLKPALLEIQNDSWQHRHHSAMRESGGGSGETHFSVQVVSDAFSGKTTIQRHKMIFATLSDEFAQGLHALSLKTKTPQEMERLAAKAEQ